MHSTNTGLRFFARVDDSISVCEVCPHRCVLRHGQFGLCRVRVNDEGDIRPVSNQVLAAVGVATVEEHPLFHFYPGTQTLCIGSTGCTARCDFCQNWELALAPHFKLSWRAVMSTDASEVVRTAIAHGCSAISFTYNEAAVWPELMLEVMKRATDQGLKNILITNAFITEQTWSVILPWLDAVKVDLKGSSSHFYQHVVGIDFRPVLRSLELIRNSTTWLEVSSVIIPGINDSEEDIKAFVDTLIVCVGYTTPWHLMRFFPAHRRINEKPGDLEQLRKIRRFAMDRGLAYVYISNVPNISEANSYCPCCSRVIAERRSQQWTPLPQRCNNCGEQICGRGLHDPTQRSICVWF